jgi:hypothetical protein
MSPTPTAPQQSNVPDYSQYTNRASAEESYRIKDGAGGRDIFLDEIRNTPKYQESLGHKLMDIIMYPAGENHPLVVAKKIAVGTMVHMTWVFVHKGIGPGQDWFICLARTYGQPCPVCELRNQIKSTPGMTDDEVKTAIMPYYSGKYPLGLYNCVHHNNPQQITWQEPVMYWAINNSFMESKLQSMSKSPIGGGFVNYQWPTAGEQGGRHVSYEVVQKGQFYDYIGHQFVVRATPIPPHVLQQAICLDDYLDVPSYEQVKDALEMGLGNPIGGEPTGQGSDKAPPWEAAAGRVFGTPEIGCPFAQYGGVLGKTLDNWEECRTCSLRVNCQDSSYPVQQPPRPPEQAAPTLSPITTGQPAPIGQTPPAQIHPPPLREQPMAPMPRRPVK